MHPRSMCSWLAVLRPRRARVANPTAYDSRPAPPLGIVPTTLPDLPEWFPFFFLSFTVLHGSLLAPPHQPGQSAALAKEAYRRPARLQGSVISLSRRVGWLYELRTPPIRSQSPHIYCMALVTYDQADASHHRRPGEGDDRVHAAALLERGGDSCRLPQTWDQLRAGLPKTRDHRLAKN